MITDILVIGSGIAGLSFSLKSSKFADIVLVTKAQLEESNTKYAQGGLAAVLRENYKFSLFDKDKLYQLSKNDSFKLHIKDTLRAGDGLCNERAVEFLVKNTPEEIKWLKKIGVKFDKELSKEAVHSRARIVHSGDITGEKVEKVLADNVKKRGIRILEYHQAISLIIGKNSCYGAQVLDVKGKNLINIFSKATVLATGGLGQIYKNTCNPAIATGDGFVLAYNAGAELQDMEFIQFHPTGFYNSKPTFLISETLRGEGGILKNKFLKPFMKNYHRDGDLAPRDVVSRFSIVEMLKTKSDFVYLDVRHLGKRYLKKRFPNIYRECLKYNIDLTKQPIPVSPTAHYSCGGVKINLKGKTNIKGLYAIGEVSCSGVHGADRLASNSLTDGLVFGNSLSNYLKDIIKKTRINRNIINNKKFNEKLIINKKINKNNLIKKELQELMWDKVGIVRNEKGLNETLEKLNKFEKIISKFKNINKKIIELKNMIIVSKIITISALRRKESRGTHFVEDYPNRDDRYWRRHLIASKKRTSK